MCIWTAWTGPGEEAGRVVHRMLRRSYGVWGGFFTGLVSNDGGRLITGRTAGDIGVWESQFDPADFRGRIAIFHSRTPSADDSAWAHPFGTKIVQLAEQGNYGCFTHAVQDCSALAAELVEAGYDFPTATTRHPEVVNQVKLPDGRAVHSDEVFAFAADRIYRAEHDPFAAMRGGLGRVPCEAVNICMFADRPDCIYVANVNQRVAIAHENGGTALSTTRLSFDDPAAGDITELPCNTIAEFCTDGSCRMETFVPGLQINRAVPAGFSEQASAWWRGKKATQIGTYWEDFICTFWPQAPGAAPDTRAIMAYHVLEELVMSGKLIMENIEARGDFAPEHCSHAVFTWRG